MKKKQSYLRGVVLEKFDYINDKLAKITDQFGQETRINRNIDSKISSVLSPLGLETRVLYDPSNRVREIREPNGNRHIFAFDPFDIFIRPDSYFLTQYTSPSGNITNYEYADNGRLLFSDKTGGIGSTFDPLSSGSFVESKEGRFTSYSAFTSAPGATRTTITEPSGFRLQYTEGVDGGQSYNSTNGFSETNVVDDVRFNGLRKRTLDQLDFIDSTTRLTQISETYTGLNSSDFFDYSTLNKNVDLNGDIFNLSYDKNINTKVETTPEGVVTTTVYNEFEQIISIYKLVTIFHIHIPTIQGED